LLFNLLCAYSIPGAARSRRPLSGHGQPVGHALAAVVHRQSPPGIAQFAPALFALRFAQFILHADLTGKIQDKAVVFAGLDFVERRRAPVLAVGAAIERLIFEAVAFGGIERGIAPQRRDDRHTRTGQFESLKVKWRT